MERYMLSLLLKLARSITAVLLFLYGVQEDKVYVQHRIVEQGALVWDLLHNHQAAFYVAGCDSLLAHCIRSYSSSITV